MRYCSTGDRKLSHSRKQRYYPYSLSKLSSFGTGACSRFHGGPLATAVHNKTVVEKIDTILHLNKITFRQKNSWNILCHERGKFYPLSSSQYWKMGHVVQNLYEWSLCCLFFLAGSDIKFKCIKTCKYTFKP